MAVSPGDAELVAAARGGDRGAFAELVGRHLPLLLTLCRRVLGDHSLVEDATQEATLQALLRLDQLQRPERFGAWYAGIALNVCRRWVSATGSRRSGSWEALSGGDSAFDPADWRPGPDELTEAADLAARIRQAVVDLPRGQRAAILLFYLSGLSHNEIAAQLGIQVGTVKTRLHKGRRMLRRKLAKVWEEENRGALADLNREAHRPATADDAMRSSQVAREVGLGGPWVTLWSAEHNAEAPIVSPERVPVPRASLPLGAGDWRRGAVPSAVPIAVLDGYSSALQRSQRDQVIEW